MVSQLRRAASSVPANIAEGCGCNGNREFARFLGIALRSASETEYHLLLARDLGYLAIKTYELEQSSSGSKTHAYRIHTKTER